MSITLYHSFLCRILSTSVLYTTISFTLHPYVRTLYLSVIYTTKSFTLYPYVLYSVPLCPLYHYILHFIPLCPILCTTVLYTTISFTLYPYVPYSVPLSFIPLHRSLYTLMSHTLYHSVLFTTISITLYPYVLCTTLSCTPLYPLHECVLSVAVVSPPCPLNHYILTPHYSVLLCPLFCISVFFPLHASLYPLLCATSGQFTILL